MLMSPTSPPPPPPPPPPPRRRRRRRRRPPPPPPWPPPYSLNSSDALDKLRLLTLTDDAYRSVPFNPRIDLELNEEQQTLTVSDTGIGMNEEELISHLGTIARSGTKNFLAHLSGDAKKDTNLIGQFGVGFYSAFMVADRVEVISRNRRRAGLALG